MDAFDSDIVIFSTKPGALGEWIRRTIAQSESLLGSVLLLPETLSWTIRHDREREGAALRLLLAKLDLKEVDLDVADAATTLGAKYGLRAADAIHLATAVVWGADRFHTNNRKDFSPDITEIDIVHPQFNNK